MGALAKVRLVNPAEQQQRIDALERQVGELQAVIAALRAETVAMRATPCLSFATPPGCLRQRGRLHVLSIIVPRHKRSRRSTLSGRRTRLTTILTTITVDKGG